MGMSQRPGLAITGVFPEFQALQALKVQAVQNMTFLDQAAPELELKMSEADDQ